MVLTRSAQNSLIENKTAVEKFMAAGEIMYAYEEAERALKKLTKLVKADQFAKIFQTPFALKYWTDAQKKQYPHFYAELNNNYEEFKENSNKSSKLIDAVLIL